VTGARITGTEGKQEKGRGGNNLRIGGPKEDFVTSWVLTDRIEKLALKKRLHGFSAKVLPEGGQNSWSEGGPCSKKGHPGASSDPGGEDRKKLWFLKQVEKRRWKEPIRMGIQEYLGPQTHSSKRRSGSVEGSEKGGGN